MPRRDFRKNPLNLSKLKKLEKKVNKIVKMSETKHVDVLTVNTEANFDVNNTTALFLPAQGDAHNQRIGDSAAPFRLTSRVVLRIGVGSTSPQFVRFMIIQSKQRFAPNTITTSGVTQVFSTADVDDVINSNLVHDNRSHYTLLHDKTYMLSDEGNKGMVINISKKISRKVEFEPGSTTTENGQIWYLFTSNIAASGTGPTVQWATRIQYKDA